MNLYEGMFLLDNQVVRADWPKAKALVCDTVVKYGGEVETARRWDERKLCYPIAGKKRGTYVLAYFRVGVEGITGLRRDLELSEDVLRYMMLHVEEVPEGELEKSNEENAEGFSFPAPPEDDEPEAAPAEAAPAKADAPAEAEAKSEEPAEKAEKAEKAADATETPAAEPEAKPSAESAEGSGDTPSEKVEA